MIPCWDKHRLARHDLLVYPAGVTAAEALSMFRTVARVSFEVCATLIVWICVFWQFVIVRAEISEPATELCGAGAAVFSIALLALWGMPLLFLAYDAVQSYRRRLPASIRWLRTLPAATATMLTPAILYLT